YLAGCDGAHSAVRQAMGTRFEGRARPDTFILCDARLEGSAALPPDVLLCTSRKGPLAMIPLRDKVWRVMSTRAGEAGIAPPTLEEMQEQLAERGPAGCELSNPQWLASFRVSERRAELFRQGRIVLAGDAAHIHSPVGGQGMNTGLLDAANLAWKLEAVLRHGGCEEVFLSSYHEERAHAADRVIRDSAARTRLAIGRTGILPAALNLGAWLAGRSRKLRDLMAASLAGTSLQYPPSSVLGADTGWHEDWRDHGFPPGRLVRDVEVSSEGGPLSLLALILSARRMTLLLFSGRRPNYRDAAAVQEIREAVAASNFPVAVLAIWHGRHTPDESWLGDPEAIAHRRFGAYGRSACLVRPDAISALRTQPADWPRTCAFLESLYPRAACDN
ncbi:MAG: FAD-dependent monooxygenase, partial [Terrimicrobiaceae bacterium]|nr:FAD-dependent monooxygenase [Terrimicrobiaceae bacterium]